MTEGFVTALRAARQAVSARWSGRACGARRGFVAVVLGRGAGALKLRDIGRVAALEGT